MLKYLPGVMTFQMSYHSKTFNRRSWSRTNGALISKVIKFAVRDGQYLNIKVKSHRYYNREVGQRCIERTRTCETVSQHASGNGRGHRRDHRRDLT